MNIYSIYDRKAQAFNTPMFMQNDPVAIRSVQNALRTPDHQFGFSPEDYVLYCIGYYNEQTGVIEAIEPTAIADVLSIHKDMLKAINKPQLAVDNQEEAANA